MKDTPEGNVDVLDPGISLIRGGPFYHAQLKTRLILPHQWNLGRRLIFAVAIGWIPLLLLTALFQPGAVVALLADYRVASRLLIAVPVLLIGQILMESKFRIIVSQVREDLIAPSDLPRFDETIRWLLRLRDSMLPELAIAALVCLHIASSFSGKLGLASAWAVEGGQTARRSPGSCRLVLHSRKPAHLPVSGGALPVEVAALDVLPVQAVAHEFAADGFTSRQTWRHRVLGDVHGGFRSCRFCGCSGSRGNLALRDSLCGRSPDEFQASRNLVARVGGADRGGALTLLRPEAGPVAPQRYPAIRESSASPQQGVLREVDSSPQGARSRPSIRAGD